MSFVEHRDSIFIRKTIKTEVSKQAGTEHRGLGREKLPEIRAWIPPSLRPQHGLTEEAQRDEVFRKVRGILNKLTPEKFQPLSNDLLSLNLNSKKILLGVIHLIFEKALDEPKYSSMYAQLCHRISKEGSTVEAENDFFENLLIRVCRDKFINRSQYSDKIIHALLATEIDEEERRYVAKQKILGNVKFIGELFKLGMLNDAIIHNMLEQLLDKKSRPHPTLEDRCEDMECLSQIFKTSGKQLDTEKSKNLIDQYFEIMEYKSNSNKYPPRIRFLLRDVIELRRDGWTPRKIARVDGPVPIQDLNSDEDYLRQQREVRSRAMEFQNRNNDRNWMDKLPLSLQSSMNNYGGPLSMTSSSSIISMNVNMNNYNQPPGRSGNGGGGGSENDQRGGYRNYRNQDRQDYNQRPMGKYNNINNNNNHNQNDGGKMNPKMKHYRQQHDNGYTNQNHHHGQNNQNSFPNNNGSSNGSNNMNMLNKDLAPRFKRTLVTPSTPNSVDDLQMRPSPNSLLFKASYMKTNQSQMPMNSMNRSAAGSPSIDNLIPSFNNMNTSNGGRNTSSPPQTQQPSQNVPPSHFMTAATQAKNNANQHHQQQQQTPHQQNLKSSPTPNSPQNVHNSFPKEILSQAQQNSQSIQPLLVTKQGSIEKPKPKKDKGPNKDEILKKVLQFLLENLLEKKFLDNYQQKIDVKVEKTSLIEEIDDSHNNNGHVINGETEIIEECLNGDSNGEECAISTLEDIVKSFYELKVPDKFLKDSIVKVINESLDKGEQAHLVTVDFLLALQKDAKLTPAQLTEALRSVINGMSEREKTIPKVTTMVASLLARGISKNMANITDIASFTENGQHFPLLLLVFQQLHKVIGEDELVDLFNNSKINLITTLPESDQTKERLAEILDDRKLSFLQPLLRIESELWKQLQADPQPQTFYKWIKDNVSPNRYTDPGFITALMTVLIKYISQESVLSGDSDGSKLPDKNQIDTERKMLASYSRILNAFLNGQLELQLIAIYTLQVYCFQHQFPKGMLLRWFTALYELEICEEEAFLRWKEDITDDYPGKGKALFQVNTWLTWLQEASEEEDED